MKEINRVHRQMYGWKMFYGNLGFIDIDGDRVGGSDGWIPMSGDEEIFRYFYTSDGDITSLGGLFAWQAHSLYHVNPYKFRDKRYKWSEGDLVFERRRERISADVGHPVECLSTAMWVQQRRDDGKIWISTNWVYEDECYEPSGFVSKAFYDILSDALSKMTGEDHKLHQDLQDKFDKIDEAAMYRFKWLLEKYYLRGRKIKDRYWSDSNVFTPSKERRIKTPEQLNTAIAFEGERLLTVLEEFAQYLGSIGINLNWRAKGLLRRKTRRLFSGGHMFVLKKLFRHLAREDRRNPSDVSLWWGGEPNRDIRYALFTFFFEIDPEDIGTSRFDDKVWINLRAIIDVAEGLSWMSSYKDYKPHIWRAIFSR